MPTCLFCKREEIPRVPLFPLTFVCLVAHVDPRGAPCHEGAAQETHSRMLGPDYPHDELLSNDDAWAIDDPAAEGVAVFETTGPEAIERPALTAQPIDRVAELERSRAAEVAEEPADLPDVEPPAPAPRSARKPRKRKADAS